MVDSRFYLLDRVPDGWSAGEFRDVVLWLESLSHEELVALASRLGLTFAGTPLSAVGDESLLDAILTDYDAGALVRERQISLGK